MPQEQQQEQPQEQPQDVGQAHKEAKAQEDSDSESSSEDDDREDAEMADASEAAADATADGQKAMVDAPDESAGQTGGMSRKQKYGDKTERKKRQSFAAAMQTPDWKAHTKGRRRKKKKNSGRAGKASQKQNPHDI
jgi:hypothetical protein